MTDTTTALENVRKALGYPASMQMDPLRMAEAHDRALAALTTIEAELARLRESVASKRSENVLYVEQIDRLLDDNKTLRAERDEAVAALREAQTAMREVLDSHGDYEEFDPLRRFLGLPLYDSTESWKRRGEEAARLYTNQAGSSPSQDRERGNEDASDQGAAHGAAGVASLASPDSQPALSTPKEPDPWPIVATKRTPKEP